MGFDFPLLFQPAISTLSSLRLPDHVSITNFPFRILRKFSGRLNFPKRDFRVSQYSSLGFALIFPRTLNMSITRSRRSVRRLVSSQDYSQDLSANESACYTEFILTQSQIFEWIKKKSYWKVIKKNFNYAQPVSSNYLFPSKSTPFFCNIFNENAIFFLLFFFTHFRVNWNINLYGGRGGFNVYLGKK